MAERKRRPPSDKIKPGTPHPTKAYTVRGYDGRWITRKAFNAAKRARERAKPAPKKGGSLVKRASSAITKASKGAVTKASKAGNLLKIRKGDKGIVRAVKDVYKLGKDTRKSANALYKAGKITREVHDKLVKGGRDFVKGTVESGKATRRAYERLKPGGKIVKSKGSKLAKYRKAALKIVKSPGGKLYRPQGGKLAVRPKDKGGQIVKTPKVKTKAKVTPKVESARRVRAKDKLAQAKRGVNKDTAFNRKYKVEGSSTNPRRVTKGGKVISEVNQGKGVKPKKLVKQAKTLGKKAVMQAKRLKNWKHYGKVVKGLKIGGKVGGQALKVLGAADITGSGYRQAGNVVRRIRKKPLKAGGAIGGVTVQFERDRIKAQNAYLKEHGSLKGFNKATSRWNKKKTDNNKLKVNKTNKQKTSSTKTKTSPFDTQTNISFEKMYKKGKGQTSTTTQPKKKGKSQAQIDWEKKTRNSPARKSGAFTDAQLWELQKQHRKWKSDRKAKKPVSKGKPLEKVEITNKKNKFKVAPKDLPKGKVKMNDGSIVDRSSLYKKKKNKRK